MTYVPFRSLSRAAQLRRLHAIAMTAVDRYWPRVDGVRLLQYEDNAVYLVCVGDRRYTLRLSVRDGRSVAEQESELAWMAGLVAARTVLVPEPVRSLAGARVEQVPTLLLEEPVSTVAVFTWIPGQIAPRCDRPGLAEELGAATAALHQHAETFRPPQGFTRPRWGRREVLDEGAALVGARATEMLGKPGVRVVGEVVDRMGPKLPPEDGPEWGLIHADLHRGNLIATSRTGTSGTWSSGTGIAVIDFDDSGFGYFMLDIATVLSSIYRVFARSGSGDYPDFAHRYLAAYAGVRRLPEALDQLESFLLLRDMIILNFVVHSENPTVATWGPVRAAGIVATMRAYLAGEPYVGSEIHRV